MIRTLILKITIIYTIFPTELQL